jgi:hypothetical protein
MTIAISRSIPPQRLITFLNPLVRAVIRSPLHTVTDSTLLLLHVRGRKTGHAYDIPVGYVNLRGHFIVVTQHAWRANVRGVADVEVTHGGHTRSMHAELDEEPGPVAATLHEVIERIGWRAARRQIGLSITVGRTPTPGELEDAVREFHLATITLIPA